MHQTRHAFCAAIFSVAISICAAAGGAMAKSVAIAHCGRTGKVGIGQGATLPSASGNAVTNCIANEGLPNCCHVVASAQTGEMCIAVAEYPGGGYIVGFGYDAQQAGNDALLRCGRSDCDVSAQVCPPLGGYQGE